MHRYLRQTGRAFPHRLVAMCPMSLRDEGDTEASDQGVGDVRAAGRADATPSSSASREVMASMAAAKAELRAMSKDAAMLYAIAALGLAELLDATRHQTA